MTLVNKNIYILAAAVFIFGLFYLPAFSQFIPSANVSLDLDPRFPPPESEVKAKASVIGINPLTAGFEWHLNGKPINEASGRGKNEFTFKTGAIGTTYNIKVFVIGEPPLSGQASLVFRTSDLSLVWSANTRVPKWYKGKALAVPESRIKVSAIPTFLSDGLREDPGNLAYRWFLDDDLINESSGVGRQNFEFNANFLPDNSYRVKVAIENDDKTIKNEKTIFIRTFYPAILVYQIKPLEGIRANSAIKDVVAGRYGDILDFIAETFFTVNSDKNPEFKWEVGGKEPTGSPKEKNILTLTTDQNSPPNTNITVSLENQERPLENLLKRFNLLLE